MGTVGGISGVAVCKVYVLQETTNHGTNIDISGKRKGKEKENLFQRNA